MPRCSRFEGILSPFGRRAIYRTATFSNTNTVSLPAFELGHNLRPSRGKRPARAGEISTLGRLIHAVDVGYQKGTDARLRINDFKTMRLFGAVSSRIRFMKVELDI